MDNKDQLFYIKNRLFKSKNIIFIFIMTLIITIIISCITLINFVSSFKVDSLNEEHGRTLVINNPKNEENIQKIKNLKHVELLESQKYLYGDEKNTTYIGDGYINGTIYFLPLLRDEDIKIKLGRKILNEGEAVCSHKLYPKSLYTSSLKKGINSSLIMHGKNIVNKNFKIELNDNYNNLEKDFKIVGTFANKELTELNICYVSKSDFDKITYKLKEYDSLIVRVDNYKNIDKVIKELESLGYASIKVVTQDEQILGYMIYIPLFIGIIVLLIAINIMYNFINKRSKYNMVNYGILKSCGYTNKNIINLEFKENLILYFISLSFSLIIYFIGCIIVQNTLMTEFVYMNYSLKIPYLYIIIFIICFVYLINLFVKKVMRRTLKNSIQNLLGE